MRAHLLALATLAASASPVPAQVDPMLQAQQNDLWMQQQALQQRQIAVENQLSAQDARIATDLRLRELEAQRLRPAVRVPSDPARTAATVGGVNASAQAPVSIPDDRLAASNARVREAAGNRR